MRALKITCLPPLPTVISSGANARPESRANLRWMACLSAGVPSCGVYLVSPRRAAWWAASTACGGLAKSGSPMVSEMTGVPVARMARARAVIAMVAAAGMRARREARSGNGAALDPQKGEALLKPCNWGLRRPGPSGVKGQHPLPYARLAHNRWMRVQASRSASVLVA